VWVDHSPDELFIRTCKATAPARDMAWLRPHARRLAAGTVHAEAAAADSPDCPNERIPASSVWLCPGDVTWTVMLMLFCVAPVGEHNALRHLDCLDRPWADGKRKGRPVLQPGPPEGAGPWH